MIVEITHDSGRVGALLACEPRRNTFSGLTDDDHILLVGLSEKLEEIDTFIYGLPYETEYEIEDIQMLCNFEVSVSRCANEVLRIKNPRIKKREYLKFKYICRRCP